MKQALLAFFIPLLVFSSCKSHYDIIVAAGHDASESDKGNFIKMKSGREVTLSDNIEVKTGSLEVDRTNTIKIDNRKYKAKDIASVQVNGDYYSNGTFDSKRMFSRRIYKGDFDVYTHTTTSTTSTYNSTSHSFSSPRTTISYQYFLQNPKINNGDLTMIRPRGNAKELDPYLKSYQPSMDILQKYRQERKISKIVTNATLGFWLSSIPMLLVAKEGTALQVVGVSNLFLGLLYTPIISFTFKGRNHRRPIKAVQTYIDNNLGLDAGLAVTAPTDKNESLDNSTTAITNLHIPGDSINNDFVVLHNKEIIVADEGTKLRSANNKIFMINQVKYTSGITAFQLRKKFYKHFPDMKDPSDFAQRSIAGKISAYNLVKGRSQNSSDLKSSNMFAGKKNTYFDKIGEDGFIKNRQKLDAYFQDNPIALSKYNNYRNHYSRFKTIYFALMGVTAATLVSTFVMTAKSNRAGTYAFGIGSVALGVGTGAYVYSTVSKLDKEFSKALNSYNGNEKLKKQRKTSVKKKK